MNAYGIILNDIGLEPMIDELQRMLTEAGFTQIRIAPQESSRALIREWLPESNLADYVVSATIEAIKP